MHGATGEVCPECGTHHWVVDTIPARPLRASELDDLEESDNVALAMPVVAAFGDLAESEDDETTREIVLSTMSAARVLSFEADHGWVVADERHHEEDEDPVEMGMWLQQKSTMGMFGWGFRESMGQDNDHSSS